MLTHRRTLPWILLVLLCLFGLTSPPGSDALVSMSPSTIPKGCSTDVAVTLSSLTEFDPQGPTNNAWAYVYFTSGGGVAQVGTNFTGTPLNNPQSWSLTIPANATVLLCHFEFQGTPDTLTKTMASFKADIALGGPIETATTSPSCCSRNRMAISMASKWMDLRYRLQ